MDQEDGEIVDHLAGELETGQPENPEDGESGGNVDNGQDSQVIPNVESTNEGLHDGLKAVVNVVVLVVQKEESV